MTQTLAHILFWFADNTDRLTEKVFELGVKLLGGPPDEKSMADALPTEEVFADLNGAEAKPEPEPESSLEELPEYAIFEAMFSRMTGYDGYFTLAIGNDIQQLTCRELYRLLSRIRNKEIPNTPNTIQVYNKALQLVLHSELPEAERVLN